MRSFGMSKRGGKPPRPEQVPDAANGADAASPPPKQAKPARSSSRGLLPRVASLASCMIPRRGRSASPQPQAETLGASSSKSSSSCAVRASSTPPASAAAVSAGSSPPAPASAAPQGSWLQEEAVVAEEPKEEDAVVAFLTPRDVESKPGNSVVSFNAETDAKTCGPSAAPPRTGQERDMVESDITEDDFADQNTYAALPSPTKLRRVEPSGNGTLAELAKADCSKVSNKVATSDLVESDVVESDFCDPVAAQSQPASTMSASNATVRLDADDGDTIGPLRSVHDMQSTTRSWRQPIPEMESSVGLMGFSSSMGFSRPPMAETAMSWTPMDRWVEDEEVIHADLLGASRNPTSPSPEALDRRSPFESLPGVPEDVDDEELDAHLGSTPCVPASSSTEPQGKAGDNARVLAQNSFQSAFMAEQAKGLSPTSAAVQALRRCGSQEVIDIDTGCQNAPGCQFEAVKSFQEAFQEQRSRGSSPNAAAAELIRRVGQPVKQEAGHPQKSMDEWGILRSKIEELEFEWV